MVLLLLSLVKLSACLNWTLKLKKKLKNNDIILFLQTQNSVYEIVSDVNSRQDLMEDRLAALDEKLSNLQLSIDLLPDTLNR